MFDSASRSDVPAAANAVPASVRGDSQVHARFAGTSTDTYIAGLYERGSLRLRQVRADGRREGVVVNTGGGITGGDRLRIDLDIADDAAAVVTSQAAEKIYRSDGPPASIAVAARLGARARLDWLPQETIVFDRASAVRSLDIDLGAAARLTLLECLVLGRLAHGERLRQASWRDRWRIHRDGRLVFADNVTLDGDVAELCGRPAIGDGANALATLLHIAPDAEARLDAVRNALAGAPFACGASAWNGMLIARLAAADPLALRTYAIRIATAITRQPMPRAWGC